MKIKVYMGHYHLRLMASFLLLRWIPGPTVTKLIKIFSLFSLFLLVLGCILEATGYNSDFLLLSCVGLIVIFLYLVSVNFFRSTPRNEFFSQFRIPSLIPAAYKNFDPLVISTTIMYLFAVFYLIFFESIVAENERIILIGYISLTFFTGFFNLLVAESYERSVERKKLVSK